MGNYEKLFEDTKQIICIAFDDLTPDYLGGAFNTNKLEDDVSGSEMSPSFIDRICKFVLIIVEELELKNLGSYRINAASCYESYLKNGNPMGFHLMMSKLLPALECPHTILTTGPVKKRLVTKKARLLLINFLVSVTLLYDDIVDIYESDSDCDDDGKGVSDEEPVGVRTGLGCELCVDSDYDDSSDDDADPKNKEIIINDGDGVQYCQLIGLKKQATKNSKNCASDPVGACKDYHSAVIAHVSLPSHMKKVVEKLEKDNNIEGYKILVI